MIRDIMIREIDRERRRETETGRDTEKVKRKRKKEITTLSYRALKKRNAEKI